jgi:uncharacterized repeat protein (TIGR03803 family)
VGHMGISRWMRTVIFTAQPTAQVRTKGGSIFKLTPAAGGWTYTSLHDFTGGSDGGNPIGPVILDSDGNLYGTAQFGGADDKGTIWEITP